MYQFKKVNDDEFILVIGDKEYPFKRTIDLAKKYQSIDLETTYVMSEFLAERGETLDNTKLRVTREENGKTIVDESNLKALEKKANTIATERVLDDVFQKLIGMKYIETLLAVGIDIKSEDNVTKFLLEFFEIVTNGMQDDTPSEQDTQGDRTEPKE